MDKAIVKNYLYNLCYQVLVMLTPLITIPYVSRVLKPEGIGVNALTFSITQYIILVITLGIPFYASREIAYQRDNKEMLRKCFWDIFTIQVIIGLVAFFISVISFYKLEIIKDYRNILLLQSINILSAVFDITWLFNGMEDFKKVVTRNITVKIIGIASIFIFIKSPDDLWKYVLLNSLISLLGQLIVWSSAPDIIGSPFKHKVSFHNLAVHLRGSVIKFFIPQIATSIYTILDKVMIGALSDIKEVAYYDQSQKIIKITLAILTSLGTVMLPRISNYFAQGENEKIKKYFINSFVYSTALAIPLMITIIGISPEFVIWFFGREYSNVSLVLQLISPEILIICWSNIFGVQYLIPIGKNKAYTLGICLAALINLSINIIFIPKFGAVGAVIGTVLAEISANIIMMYFISKDFSIKHLLKSTTKYFLSGIVMFLCMRAITIIINVKVITTLIQIITGVFVYFICLVVLRERLVVDKFINLSRRIQGKIKLSKTNPI